MKYDTDTIIFIVKELFKLPCDKETGSVEGKDLQDVVKRLVGLIPEKEQEALLEKMTTK